MYEKSEIKFIKNIVLCASSDILLSLGESRFQTRKWHYLRQEHWALVTLKIWNISAKYLFHELKKTQALNMAKKSQNAASTEKGRKW